MLVWLVAGACSKSAEQPPVVETKPVVADAAAAPAKDTRYDSEALGAIKFELTEGTPAARERFLHGLLAMHSFWYDEAVRQFDAAIELDPSMRMAYWGAALARCKIFWGDDDVGAARDLLNRMPDPQGLSPRLQAWVMAAVALLTKGDVRESRKRFVRAMEALHAKFPDDESATFLALALLSSTRPEDPDTVEVRKRAADLARGVYERNPKHPGAAHYLIHAFDMPGHAQHALPQAKDYAKIAPAAFHARHMPAHIFSRLGMWPEAIASCKSAWDSSVAAAQREKLSANHHDFHSLSWIIEMSFELGHRRAADTALAQFANAVRDGLNYQQRMLYATQVASYMARTGEWHRVDELLKPLDSLPVLDPGAARLDPRTTGTPMACSPGGSSSNEALIERVFVLDARARAASRKDLAATKQLVAEGKAARDQLRPFFEATQPKETLEAIERTHERQGRALIARASKDDRALLAVLAESVADSEKEVGGEVNPTGLLQREEMAEIQLRLKRPKDAVASYQAVLQKFPRRARALLGLARAQKAAGDAAGSRATYQQLAVQWATAEDGTDGLAEVRAAVAR